MGEVSWIKLDVDLFDNRKAKRLRRLDCGDAALLTWIFLLVTAGKCNDGGRVFISEGEPYEVEDIADELGYDPQITALHLAHMERLDMIHTDELGFIHICGWEDHQNTDRLAELRTQHNERQRRYMERKKTDVKNDVINDVSTDVSMMSQMTSADALDKDKELDIDKDKELDKREIEIKREYEGEKTDAGKKPAPSRHRYGTYNRVLLSDDDLTKLKAEFSADWQERIDRLDEYIEIHGDKYKNHLATIRAWARKDKQDEHIKQPAGRSAAQTGAPRREYGIVI